MRADAHAAPVTMDGAGVIYCYHLGIKNPGACKNM